MDGEDGDVAVVIGLANAHERCVELIKKIRVGCSLSEQHFTEGDEMEDDLNDDNIDYIIIEEIERSRKAV